MIDLEGLKRNFGRIDFREKRPGLYKVIIPYFYEDGDMYDIFIEEIGTKIRISDRGLTLMKLSYSFDLDTQHKKEVLENIIFQNRCKIETGNIYLDVIPSQFTGGIYQYIQTISKVSTIDIISKEIMKSYFLDFFTEFVSSAFEKYHVQSNITPTQNSDLIVDFVIPESKKPLYIFGVNDDSKASKAVISCLTFQTQNLPFRSIIVHEDFNKLSQFNRNQITNTADKQFTSLEDFKSQGSLYIEREIA